VRISFRTKLFLALVATVALLLGASLALMERAYSAQMADLIALRVEQGHANFHLQNAHRWRDLWRDGGHLAGSPRLRGSLEDSPDADEVAGNAVYDVRFHNVHTDFLTVTLKSGRPIAHLRRKPGRAPDGVPHPLEPVPPASRPDVPEAPFIEKVRQDPEAFGDDTGEDDPAREGFFLVDEGRLYQVVARPILDGDRFRGVLVLGLEVTHLEDFFPEGSSDGAGYAVGPRLIASTFSGAASDSAGRAVASRVREAAPTAHPDFEAALNGAPYRVFLDPIPGASSAEPVATVLFVSIERLVAFRERMRTLFVLAAAAGLGASLLLSHLIARGISRPVRDLVAGTERIAGGDYVHRVAVRSRDELGDLAGAFNRMAGDLAVKEKIRGVLNKVVAKDVAEELLKGDLGLGGRHVRATLLFADLRGFTSMSQTMTPEAVVAMLNEHMTAMTREIFACRGIVDKYVGDEIIGVFGAPKSHGSDALDAVRAACRMRERLAALNEVRRARGDSPLAMGVGIHTGDVVAGCMGSEELLNYTCIGEVVNLASRLCSNAKAGQVLISEATRSEAGPAVEAAALPPITVKGVREPVPVFDVMRVARDGRHEGSDG
jgi:class 3 adenylate cyclase